MADQESEALAIRQATAVGESGIRIETLEDAWRFAQMVVKAKMAPASLDTPEKILVAVQTGMEAGLSPMQSVRSVYVVNGTGAWMGEAALALVRASGKCEWWKETKAEGEGDARVAVVRSKRTDDPTTYESPFSVADAKKAGLWSKNDVWKKYPDRMLMWRARGFHCKDHYSDVLRGLAIAEEVRDYPSRDQRRVVDVTPPPAKPDPLLMDAPGEEDPGEPMAGELVDGAGEGPAPFLENGEPNPDYMSEPGQGEML